MSNTTNLNLFKHDNPEQNTNPFDVEEALNKNWDKVDTYAGNVNEDITTINSAIENINGDITDIQTEQTTQNTNIQTNTNNIASLTTRVGTNENSITNINTTIGNIQTEQTTQNNKISALETDNTTNKTNIATLQTDSGHIISLELNTTNYVLTATLKNKAGVTLNTSSIDLPVEQLVVSVTYDSISKELVITLKNGQTTRVPLGDLISGLQTEITSSNKLSSDLVDDTNNTHKFVSTGEKETWNAKYNKPSSGIPKTDLSSSVQTSLGKADTAIQEHQDISGKEDKANKVTELTSASTNTQYPSAKVVYDELEEIKAENIKLENKIAKQQSIINQMPQVSGSGTDVTLNNTIESELTKFDIEGNSTQDGTPSLNNEVPILSAGDPVNLFNGSNSRNAYPNNTPGQSVTWNSSSATKSYINCAKVKQGQNYTISYKPNTPASSNTRNSIIVDSNNIILEYFSINPTQSSYTYTAQHDGDLILTMDKNATEIQIEKGSEVTPYRPYGLGIINERIVNKNWLDTTKYVTTSAIRVNDNMDGKIDMTGINGYYAALTKTFYLKANETFYITTKATTDTVNAIRLDILDKANNQILKLTSANLSANLSGNFTVPQDGKVNVKFFCNYNNNTANTKYENIMLSMENGATFVPHQEQTYTIPVQRPMRRIGNVRDGFVKVNGVWNEKHMPYIASYNGETLPQDVYNEVEGIKYCNEKSMSTTGQFSTGATVQYIDENNWTLLECTAEQKAILDTIPSTYKEQTNIYSEDTTPAYVEASGLYDLNNLITRVEVIESES